MATTVGRTAASPAFTGASTTATEHRATQLTCAVTAGTGTSAMGFSFRKSFKLAPGVRLNVGKRSAGISAGPRGAKLGANTRGQKRASVGAKGFRWTKFFR